METETLDKLYLEWSRFTKARTEREIVYARQIRRALDYLSGNTEPAVLNAKESLYEAMRDTK